MLANGAAGRERHIWANRQVEKRERMSLNLRSSGLITARGSACIGKTYRAISKTFEHYNDLEAFARCHFAESSGVDSL